MDPTKLKDYELEQMEAVAGHAHMVREKGLITSSTDLYPDLHWPVDTAYRKGNVPLSILVLFYDRVVIYVPPLPRQHLEQRWGLPYDTVLQLARAGLIQILIGHPTDYAAEHFDPLLRLRPPSVWSRGLALLHALELEHTLPEAYERLPMSAMASLPWIRERWARHFPDASESELTAKIGRELAVNYADLWVFGEREIAESLPGLDDPAKIARGLLLFNEVRTYPLLFGLEGIAHYDLASVQADPRLVQQVLRLPGNRPVFVPDELKLLTEGIGLDVSSLDAETLVEFHSSERGRHLRLALKAFEEQAGLNRRPLPLDEFFEAAGRFQRLLLEAAQLLNRPDARRQMRKTQGRVQWLFRAGGVAVGALIGSSLGASWLTMLGPASGVGMLIAEKLVPEQLRQNLVTQALAQQFSPGVAHAWRSRQRSST